MRHRNAGRKYSRTPEHRKSMFRNLLTSFFRHEKITTTDPKAKELKRLAEKIITMGKAGDLNNIRKAASIINDPEVVTKIFKNISPRFKDRAGGYTRIVKLGKRLGDGADMSIIELIEGVKAAEGKKEKRKKGASVKDNVGKKASSGKKAAAKTPEISNEKAAEPVPVADENRVIEKKE